MKKKQHRARNIAISYFVHLEQKKIKATDKLKENTVSSPASIFLVCYVGERTYNASTREERRKRKDKRREGSDQVY